MQQVEPLAREGGVTSISPHHGSPAVMDRFAAENRERLVRFAYLLSGSPDDAQDLTQSVLYRLNRRGIDDLDDPVAYARRCLINEYRSMLRRFTTFVGALPRLAPTSVRPDPTADIDTRESTRAALEALAPRQRAAVVLRYYEDWSDEQIAQALGCAPGTVRSLLSRSMPILRAKLEDSQKEES